MLLIMCTYILALFPGAEEGERRVPGNRGGGRESAWVRRRGRGEYLGEEEGEGRVPGCGGGGGESAWK